MYVDLNAWGNATQLGKYTAHFVATVDVAGCSCSVGDTIAFTAANGDSLYGVGSAVGVPPPDKPGFHEVTHIMAITGGTGPVCRRYGQIHRGAPGQPRHG